jgi:hypothetical protein
MTTKAESDLLTQVLTAAKPVDGDLKFFMQKLITGRTGNVKLVDREWLKDLNRATFSTKVKVMEGKNELEMSITFQLTVGERNYGKKRDREMNLCAIRGRMKGKDAFTDNSPFWSIYSSQGNLVYSQGDRENVNFKDLVDTIIKKCKSSLKYAEKAKARNDKAVAKAKAKAINDRKEIIESHGFTDQGMVSKAYDKAAERTWGNKATIKARFAFYAELLKADPYKVEKDGN